jgi:predicted ATP-grasp superfamily ATP-dependent carboligase
MPNNLLIFGASARAAAFSALRAGLSPWCADLFADADLQARCPAMRLPADRYPHGFLYLDKPELKAPWMFTGGLENHVDVIKALAGNRMLWGNRASAVSLTRDPAFLGTILRGEGVPAPRVRPCFGALPRSGRWLIKPRRGAGGSGIRFFAIGPECARAKRRGLLATVHEMVQDLVGALPVDRSGNYLQEFIDGTPLAAVFVGEIGRCRFLGATRQLVGAEWLHAKPFQYCGSIGPVELNIELNGRLKRLGSALERFGLLRGLFGVDCILRDSVPWPVEVNPRYTASIEVLEYGAGVPAMALHRRVFETNAPAPRAKPQAAEVVGKAILYARETLVFPEDGPWMATLRNPGLIDEMPAFADIPHAGEPIEARRPILTFFARAASEDACLAELKAIAADLDRWLFNR